jgi:branched-chain amino acid transport system substrate-binding protein
VLTTDTDFLALLTKITAKNPDALFLALTAEQAASFIIQARQGASIRRCASSASRTWAPSSSSPSAAKRSRARLSSPTTFPNAQSAENQRFVAEYKKRYNRLPDNGAALGYTAIKLAAAAIHAAGPQPTREKIRAALAKIKGQKVILGRGDFSYDDSRGALYGAVILAVKNGKIVPAPSAY